MKSKAASTQLIKDYASNSLQAESLATKYLKEKPDSIFCMSDEILSGVMISLHKRD